jgi:uncharacterized protein YbbC (DUF1343 family)
MSIDKPLNTIYRMKTTNALLLLACITVSLGFTSTANGQQPGNAKTGIVTGAQQTEKYVPLLQGKRVAVLANQTTIIGKRHLVDSLLARGVNIVKVFGPEHGFRGNASAGVDVGDEKDRATGLKVIAVR